MSVLACTLVPSWHFYRQKPIIWRKGPKNTALKNRVFPGDRDEKDFFQKTVELRGDKKINITYLHCPVFTFEQSPTVLTSPIRSGHQQTVNDSLTSSRMFVNLLPLTPPDPLITASLSLSLSNTHLIYSSFVITPFPPLVLGWVLPVCHAFGIWSSSHGHFPVRSFVSWWRHTSLYQVSQ